ncbi:MAG: diphthine synthase [Ignisphaera sp.]
MIRLIGLGLSIDLVPIGALFRLLSCQKIYIDTYTSDWFPSIDYIADIFSQLGVEVVMAKRENLEGESINKIVEEAKFNNICIAVIGDPMIATTHSAIIVEALNKDIEVEVLPASSILNTAISLSCLQAYRFGKIVTIVKPKSGIFYEYPLQVIKMNRERDLHTLTLLEIDLEQKYYMTPKEAIEILLTIQKNTNDDVLKEKDKIIIIKAVGSENGRIEVMTIEEILKKEFEKTLYTLIIPAKTFHPIEEECLQNISKILVKPQVNTHSLKLVIKIIAKNMKQKLYNI